MKLNVGGEIIYKLWSAWLNLTKLLFLILIQKTLKVRSL